MGNIVLLDDLTINKIAAGEVIERPASVVKELVENSIDAGATNINVEIKNGGISYIRVTDNGKGFLPEDMEIAFERHATSKIRSAEDLETVKSMGFRGEALASIAAIARVELKSKRKEYDTGYQIVVEGGDVINKQEAGCPNGTTITIENLFYNTPVRYKFLKKDFTEAGYIEDVITRIALIHPELSIKLVSSGKTVIQTSGTGQMKNVVYNIYGKDIAENILDVNYEYEDIKVTGVIGKPSIARSNRSNQLFFVNQRYIKDKTLTSGAEQAYKGMITIGKFGFVILNLQINPQKVDVNVHPAKLEVRFEEEQKVFKAVYHAIKDTLLKGDLVTDTEKEEKENEEVRTIEKLEQNEEKVPGLFQKVLRNKDDVAQENSTNVIADLYQDRYNTNSQEKQDNFNTIMNKMAEMKKSVQEYKEESIQDEEKEVKEEKVELDDTIKMQMPKQYDEETKVITEEMKEELVQTIQNQQTQVIDLSSIREDNMQKEEDNEENKKEFDQEYKEEIVQTKGFEEMYTSVFGRAPITEKVEEQEQEKTIIPEMPITEGDNLSVFEEEEIYQIPSYKFIGIAFSTYIIIELDKELYIIDQHAAHERIMYEKVKENYNKDENKDSQLMLLPDIITLTHKEMDIARDNMDIFRKAGFVLEEFGENTIKLTGVPNICLELDTKELFLETLDEINTVARTAKQEVEEKFLATVACKAAVKANMALTKEEVESLLDKLLLLPNPFTCPHGRPTAIKMTKTDIEKKFSRR